MTTFERISLEQKLHSTVDFAARQVTNLVDRYPDYYPMYTVKGRWKHLKESWTNWCEGFLGGQMWILFTLTNDPLWKETAEHYSRGIENRKTDRSVHDLGFIFWPTYKRWFDICGDEDLKQVVITAGQTLGKRFIEKGEYFRSFLAHNSLFIDIMMNVGIVFYAARETSDDELYEKAYQHCLTTRRYLVRGDGSTAHEGIFDVETGEFLHQSTQQGWRSDSTWARGLAWALYGFGTAFIYSGDERFLDTASRCADFYITNTISKQKEGLPIGIPPNDFDDPQRPILPESSAGAIASSGLFQLAKLINDDHRATEYEKAAFDILTSLLADEYLACFTRGWEGILKHGIYHLRKGLGVDESVMWGEFFFLESVEKALAILKGQ